MPKKEKYPFKCSKCEKQSKKDFIIYKETGDYLIIYPNENLIHFHMGEAPIDEDKYMIKTRSLVKKFLDWFNKYPQKNFCVLLDFSRTTNTSYAPPEAIPLYMKVVGKKQYKKIIVYGAMPSIASAGKAFLALIGKDVKFVKTFSEAEKEIEKWKKELSKE